MILQNTCSALCLKFKAFSNAEREGRSLLNFAKDHAAMPEVTNVSTSPCLRSKLALKLAYPCDDGPSP